MIHEGRGRLACELWEPSNGEKRVKGVSEGKKSRALVSWFVGS